MKEYLDEIVAEVRKNREELLAEHGGIEAYLKYLDEQRPKMEAMGFKYATKEELEALKSKKEPVTL